MVSTPDRRKQRQLCHINMLKEYCTREDDSASKSAVPVALLRVTNRNTSPNNTEGNVDLLDGCGVRLKILKIWLTLKLSYAILITHKLAELKAVVQDSLTLFPDVPSRTNVVYHDVNVREAELVKQPPYRVDPQT